MIVRHRTSPALDLDRAFEQLTNSFFDTRRTAGPVIDGTWVDGEYVLTVDLPGVPASAVNVSVTGMTLTIDVETDEITWKRRLRLGGRLNPERVDARHLDGRLTVTVGSYDEPEARQISIDTSAPAIEASSTDSDESSADEAGALTVDSTDA